MSRRLSTAIAALAATLCLAAPAAAQSAYQVATRVQASVSGATFWVDGLAYTGSAIFNWPEGSKHILEIRNVYIYQNAPADIALDPRQYSSTYKTRYSFQGWRTNGTVEVGLAGPLQIITADRKSTLYMANFLTEHQVEIMVNSEPITYSAGECAGRDNPEAKKWIIPSRAGFINTTFCDCLDTSGFVWVTEGSSMQLNPVAYPGYVFAGFDNPPGPQGYASGQVTITKPVNIRANFVQARRTKFETTPVRGLTIQVDRNALPTKKNDNECLPMPSGSTSFVTPTSPFPGTSVDWSQDRVCKSTTLCIGELDLLPGTDHLLGTPPVQTDGIGKNYVFDSWDTGDGQSYPANSVLRVPSGVGALNVTARFVEAARIGVQTSEYGLKIAIDGNPTYTSSNFDWGVGHTHKISVPAEQRDAKGRLWRFKKWSNGGPIEQEYTVPAELAGKGTFLVAEYELLGQLVVRSTPPALKFDINGTECATPCTIDRPAGEQVTVTPLAESEITPDTKLVMHGWDIGSSGALTHTFTQEARTATALYHYSHRITLVSDPVGAAQWDLQPAAGPGFFLTAGEVVDIKVKANKGFKFRRFEGALSGTYPEGSVTMAGPRTVQARFDEIPDLPENSVRNAAGETPDPVVAPGSVISVNGIHLAPDFADSKSNPLSQSLAGVTLQVRDRILPLFWVSPTEIQAQLFSDMTPGEYSLTLKTPGQPTIATKFEIAENAPGLFRKPELEQPIAEAYHLDGKPITPESPAKLGETVLLHATGLGRFKPQPLDGFKVPDKPEYTLAVPFELYLDGVASPVISSYAQPGRVGRAIVKFQLGAGPVEGNTVQVKVKVKERFSNTVLLPVAVVKAAETEEVQQQ